MKNKLILLASLICQVILAQEYQYMTGLLPDDGTYATLPCKAELMTRDYQSLPRRYSLMPYCPYVKSQGPHGTCTAWATAYAARTIAEAVKNGWTDRMRITKEAFSPIYVYAQIKKDNYDTNCKKGSHIYAALDLMKRQGCAKFSSFSDLCASIVGKDIIDIASDYKIDDYVTLFSIENVSENEKIRKVKKSVSEDRPVVIAMHLPQSFYQAGNTWSGMDVDPSKHGYHAMCVIGYDDEMNGGAFHVMNSWGRNWGNDGFVWVKYNDFAKFVDQAYELYVKKRIPAPRPQPVIVSNHSGDVLLQLSTGEQMASSLISKNGVYKIVGSYISGTRYRIYISNNEPAYVYVIGSDLKNSVSKVFPPTDNISAALTYKSNHIAIPDETYFVELDNNIGTDYICVLYSKDALDINNIIYTIKNTNGTFYYKVRTALGKMVVSPSEVIYSNENIQFSASTEKTVVPIIVEITHK